MATLQMTQATPYYKHPFHVRGRHSSEANVFTATVVVDDDTGKTIAWFVGPDAEEHAREYRNKINFCCGHMDSLMTDLIDSLKSAGVCDDTCEKIAAQIYSAKGHGD